MTHFHFATPTMMWYTIRANHLEAKLSNWSKKYISFIETLTLRGFCCEAIAKKSLTNLRNFLIEIPPDYILSDNDWMGMHIARATTETSWNLTKLCIRWCKFIVVMRWESLCNPRLFYKTNYQITNTPEWIRTKYWHMSFTLTSNWIDAMIFSHYISAFIWICGINQVFSSI